MIPPAMQQGSTSALRARARPQVAWAAVPLALALAGLPRAQCHDFHDVDILMNTAVTALGLQGISVQLAQYGFDVHERAYGGYQIDTVIPIASGSKWLSATAILTLVDSGQIKLNDKVGRYLPSFGSGPLSTITIRQCLSHMSGLQSTDGVIGNQQLTLAQAVDRIAQLPLAYAPDSAFQYGELGFQVAGRIAEVVSQKTWAQFFAERIEQPLGLTSTSYGNTANPHLGGGASSCLRDYGTFLKMLRNGGQHGTRQILSPLLIAEMTRDQTHGAPMFGWNPNGARYGLGCWRDRVDLSGRVLQLGSIGAFGFAPWLDLERDVCGILMVNDSVVRTYALGLQLMAISRNMLKPTGVSCVGASSACNGQVFANATAVPYQGSADFALRCEGAPPSGSGFLLIAAAPDPVGTPLLGARLHLGLAPLPTPFGVISNASGHCFVQFPLTGAQRELRFAAQFAWLTSPLCADPLGSSNALALVVQ